MPVKASQKTRYQCSECGEVTPKWTGQCAVCQAWNTLVEIPAEKPARSGGGRAAVGAAIQRLDQVAPQQRPRLSTGSAEFDRALGGGLINGSVTLLGGDPGIGKSTLLLQTLAALGAHKTIHALYVTGEESMEQVSLRASRLGLDPERLFVLAENQLESIIATTQERRQDVLVVDSIQTIFSETLQSAPGAVAQVRECAAGLVRLAKQTGVTVLLVGHVTKEGALAGPRMLEHVVDTVLYFEGDNDSRYRMIRTVKNRYGAVNELGVFAMTERGLRAVSNPSAIFLANHGQPASGTVILATREGSRPLLLEVQALVDQAHGGTPRRVTVGLEQNRLFMLLAVLHRHAGVSAHNQDVFVNVVGGVRVTETAADLAVLAAVFSSLHTYILPNDLVIFGELGLSGEVRPVQDGQARLKEAGKHGFKQAIIPAANAPRRKQGALQLHPVNTLSEALAALKSLVIPNDDLSPEAG